MEDEVTIRDVLEIKVKKETWTRSGLYIFSHHGFKHDFTDENLNTLFLPHLTHAFKKQTKPHMFCPWVSLLDSRLDCAIFHFEEDSEQYEVLNVVQKLRTW